MHRFYFNDCIPALENQVLFTERLCFTLKEFSSLLAKDIEIERGIVTHSLPSNSYYGNSFSLSQAIEAISDRQIRDVAYSLFVRFPIAPFFDDTAESLISEKYEYHLTESVVEATNLAIVAKNDGFIFSVSVSESININPLKVSVNKGEQYLILPNLFGLVKNTTEIENEIAARNAAQLGIYDQLINVLDDPKVTNQFPRDFNSLTTESKMSVLKHFEEAKNRIGIKDFNPDGDLIKNVTAGNAKNSVFELRIFKPQALRVYFSEKNGMLYLAGIGYKSSGNQDSDIKAAAKAIDKLILVRK